MTRFCTFCSQPIPKDRVRRGSVFCSIACKVASDNERRAARHEVACSHCGRRYTRLTAERRVRRKLAEALERATGYAHEVLVMMERTGNVGDGLNPALLRCAFAQRASLAESAALDARTVVSPTPNPPDAPEACAAAANDGGVQ